MTLSMSAINAVLEQLRSDVDDEESGDRLSFARANDPSVSHFDWQSAGAFSPLLEKLDRDADFQSVCREACMIFAQSENSLLRLAGKRDSFIGTLSTNELEVFRNAGLLELIPCDAAVEWWDTLRSKIRLDADTNRLEQGRVAERWSLDREMSRLKAEGCEIQPVWIALDGDGHGYDVLSYELNEQSNWTNLIIEVKSYASDNKPSFYITRREWDRAEVSKPHYEIHVWSIKLKQLTILRFDDVEPHIPKNQLQGVWEDAQIFL